MSQNLEKDELNRLWEHGLHEDQMFHNRLNFFLVFESVLLSVVGLLYSRTTTAKLVLISIICLGLILTILWGYVQARHKYVYDSLRAIHREKFPLYNETLKKREQIKWPISSRALEAYGVPNLVALIWIVLLIFTITT